MVATVSSSLAKAALAEANQREDSVRKEVSAAAGKNGPLKQLAEQGLDQILKRLRHNMNVGS